MLIKFFLEFRYPIVFFTKTIINNVKINNYVLNFDMISNNLYIRLQFQQSLNRPWKYIIP